MASELKKKLDKIYSQIEKLAVQGKEKTQDYYLLVDEFINKGNYENYEICLYTYYFIDISKMTSVQEVKMKTWPEILTQTKTPFLKKLGQIYKSKKVYQQGFDLFSIDPKYIQISLSGPLSQTYSVVTASQSISITRIGDNIKLTTLNQKTNRISIYKSEWKTISGVETPTNQELLQTILITGSSSTFNTEIPTTHGCGYLIKTEERYIIGISGSSYQIQNYKLSLNQNSFLGSITEIETIKDGKQYQLSARLQRLNNNIITALQVDKVGSTGSVIISEENPDFTYDSNLINKYTQALNILLS